MSGEDWWVKRPKLASLAPMLATRRHPPGVAKETHLGVRSSLATRLRNLEVEERETLVGLRAPRRLPLLSLAGSSSLPTAAVSDRIVATSTTKPTLRAVQHVTIVAVRVIRSQLADDRRRRDSRIRLL